MPRALLSGDRELLQTGTSLLYPCAAGPLETFVSGAVPHKVRAWPPKAPVPIPGPGTQIPPPKVAVRSSPLQVALPKFSLPPGQTEAGPGGTVGSPFLSLALEETRWSIRGRALGPDTWVTATLPLHSLNFLDPDFLICRVGIIVSTSCKGLE